MGTACFASIADQAQRPDRTDWQESFRQAAIWTLRLSGNEAKQAVPIANGSREDMMLKVAEKDLPRRTLIAKASQIKKPSSSGTSNSGAALVNRQTPDATPTFVGIVNSRWEYRDECFWKNHGRNLWYQGRRRHAGWNSRRRRRFDVRCIHRYNRSEQLMWRPFSTRRSLQRKKSSSGGHQSSI